MIVENVSVIYHWETMKTVLTVQSNWPKEVMVRKAGDCWMTLNMEKEMTVVTVVGDDDLQEKVVDDVFSSSVCCSVLL